MRERLYKSWTSLFKASGNDKITYNTDIFKRDAPTNANLQAVISVYVKRIYVYLKNFIYFSIICDFNFSLISTVLKK